jgi:hypothetical protein
MPPKMWATTVVKTSQRVTAVSFLDVKLIRAVAWLGGGALIVLAARAVVYGLSPSPLAQAFEHEAGGPALPFVVVVAGVVGVGLAAAAVGLAALGVRERALLAEAPPPPLRLWRLLVRAVVLFVATSFSFALFESWEHWRAGLGWHGLHCLTGPVHRNAIPILAALSLVAAALAAALEHVLAWMRRTIARIRRGRLEPIPLPVFFAPRQPALVGAAVCALGARGPPKSG